MAPDCAPAGIAQNSVERKEVKVKLAISAICMRFRITGLFILIGEDRLRPGIRYPEPDGEFKPE